MGYFPNIGKLLGQLFPPMGKIWEVSSFIILSWVFIVLPLCCVNILQTVMLGNNFKQFDHQMEVCVVLYTVKWLYCHFFPH